MASLFSSPWPDPNSPVLSKINFGVPLVELFKWLDVRDTLLGHNYKKQDITAALALARECKHPDAEWLTFIFERKEVSTREEAKKVFLLHQNDARALCFAWWMSYDRMEDRSRLCRAAEMGYAFACSSLCEEVSNENTAETFRLAQLAAGSYERDGFFWYGRCLESGIGCERERYSAKDNFLIAAELGDPQASQVYGMLRDQIDPAGLLWLSRAALHGCPNSFLDCLPNLVNEFFSAGSGIALIVFLIGRALQGRISVKEKKFFGVVYSYSFESLIGPATQAIAFYKSQIQAARLAVDMWTLVGMRSGIVKDIRVWIGKMVWEARFEANYKI